MNSNCATGMDTRFTGQHARLACRQEPQNDPLKCGLIEFKLLHLTGPSRPHSECCRTVHAHAECDPCEMDPSTRDAMREMHVGLPLASAIGEVYTHTLGCNTLFRPSAMDPAAWALGCIFITRCERPRNTRNEYRTTQS